jgi:hypothetical protein
MYEVVQELFCQTLTYGGFGLLKEEHIHLKNINEKKNIVFTNGYLPR